MALPNFSRSVMEFLSTWNSYLTAYPIETWLESRIYLYTKADL